MDLPDSFLTGNRLTPSPNLDAENTPPREVGMGPGTEESSGLSGVEERVSEAGAG